MITLKTKSKNTKNIIDKWLKKLRNGQKLTQSQGASIERTLSNWFKDEDEIKQLHEKWHKFHEKAEKFQVKFESSNIRELVCKMHLTYTI